MTEQTPTIHGVFPCPVYIVKRDTNLSPKEEKEIRKIVKEGMHKNVGNSASDNSDIFNGKLKKIKQFCEQHIKSYVEQVICPTEELNGLNSFCINFISSFNLTFGSVNVIVSSSSVDI